MLSTRARRDTLIQHAVLHALEHDDRVRATDIGVIVHHGVVTLTGVVSNYGEKVAAINVAHHVRFVRDVADNIQVKAPGTAGYTDTEVAEMLGRTLEQDALVPHGGIHTTVCNGWVRLEGNVPRASGREEAEHLAWQVPGVHGVTNRITIDADLTPGQGSM